MRGGTGGRPLGVVSRFTHFLSHEKEIIGIPVRITMS